MVYRQYAPVPAPSSYQAGRPAFGLKPADPKDYSSLGFSDEFKGVYGTPTHHYTGFARLALTTSFNKNIVPHSSLGFIEFVEKSTFLQFCNNSDNMAAEKKEPILGRREMEAAWCQTLLAKYEKETKENIVALMDRNEYTRANGEEGAYKSFKKMLETSIESRFYPTEKVEKYWAEKGQKHPDLDVEKLDHGYDEAPGNNATNWDEEDEEKSVDEDGDITMGEADEGDEDIDDGLNEDMEDLGLERMTKAEMLRRIAKMNE